jgi:uncharacterized membrane protein
MPRELDVITDRRIIWIGFWLVSSVLVLPQFIVPLALPTGTIHLPAVDTPNEPVLWPYAVGASFCHQRSDRSFTLNGNQLPVCERCLAIEIGIVIASCAAVVVQPKGGFFSALGAFLPSRLRSQPAILAVGLALMLPMAIDGSLQLITTYISATPQRLATGFLFGIGYIGLAIGCVSMFWQYLIEK